jgi:AcrR family transcriptional regulator
LSKPDWFTIAERVLIEHGSTALTIDELTRRAGVTKGSFYHHFGSQAGFVDAFLAHLSHLGFAEVMAEVDAEASPRDQVRQLAHLIAGHDPALEIAVRRWSASSPAVADMLREVDRMRLEFLREQFERESGDPGLALKLARWNLAFYLGTLLVTPPIHGEEYQDGAARLGMPRTPAGRVRARRRPEQGRSD